MDDHRSADALTDATLDRDLESVLAVDPSPGFVTRVRTRVQSERDASWSALQWGFVAAAAAIAVVVAVVVGTSRPNRSQIAQEAPVVQKAPVAHEPPVAQDFSPAPTAPKRAVATSTRQSVSRHEPDVIFAADEARALRRLFADVRKGLIDLSSLQEGAAATEALQPPGEIAFPPITFEPIAIATAESAEEGERQ
jgi:negative regulator of sigma E activity